MFYLFLNLPLTDFLPILKYLLLYQKMDFLKIMNLYHHILLQYQFALHFSIVRVVVVLPMAAVASATGRQ